MLDYTPQDRRERMSVVVQYIVKVSDVDRFVATSQRFSPMMEEMGCRFPAALAGSHGICSLDVGGETA
jgi:hypothetical protein